MPKDTKESPQEPQEPGAGERQDGACSDAGAGAHNPSKPEHKFWSTQPVPQAASDISENTQVAPIRIPDLSRVSKVPLPLPPEFEWCELEIGNDAHMQELQKFLRKYYVEDDAGVYRFEYSTSLLRWWLSAPSCSGLPAPENPNLYSVGLRLRAAGDGESKAASPPAEGAVESPGAAGTAETAGAPAAAPEKPKIPGNPGELVGYISGIPADMAISGTDAKMLLVDFLCLRRDLRNSRLAPIMIQELTRRAYLHGIYQAVYTGGKDLSQPVMTAPYFHRLLNVSKLVHLKFAAAPPGMALRKYQEENRLPLLVTHLRNNFRELREGDLDKLHKIYHDFAARRFRFYQKFTPEAFRHFITNLDRATTTYVFCKDDEPIAFISWYTVDSAVLDKKLVTNKAYSYIRNAYIFQFAIEKDRDPQLTDQALFLCAMHKMVEKQCDVCTCLAMGSNFEPIRLLRFAQGDGRLNYYMFNTRWVPLDSTEVSVCLV